MSMSGERMSEFDGVICRNLCWGSCQDKTNPKIREKNWLARPHTPTPPSIHFFRNMYKKQNNTKNTKKIVFQRDKTPYTKRT